MIPNMHKCKVRLSYLISHFMHLLETIRLGSIASWEYTRKVHTTTPAHETCSFPANYTISLSLWHFHWLIVVSRSRLHWSAFYLKTKNFNHYRHYQSNPLVFVRQSFFIMTTAKFCPFLDEVQACLTDPVFPICTLLFWLAFEFEVSPSNEGVHNGIRVEKGETNLNLYNS